MAGWNPVHARDRASAILGVGERAYRSWRDDRTIRLGAGLAYYALFGVVPFVTLAVYIAGLVFSQQEIQSFVADALVRLLGQEEATSLGAELSGRIVDVASGGSLGLIGLGSLVFAASLLLAALQDALNVIFGVPVEAGLRRSVIRRLWLFLLVLGFSSAVLASLIIRTVVTWLLTLFRLEDIGLVGSFSNLLGVVLSLVLVTAALAFIYRAMPQTEVPWRAALAGSIAACLAGSIAVVGVQAYLGRFATTSVQGAAGGLALILTLVYALSQVVLAGAQLTKTLALEMQER